MHDLYTIVAVTPVLFICFALVTAIKEAEVESEHSIIPMKQLSQDFEMSYDARNANEEVHLFDANMVPLKLPEIVKIS